MVKDSLLQADATLAPRLFKAFTDAKAIFLEELSSGAELSGFGPSPTGPFCVGPSRVGKNRPVARAKTSPVTRSSIVPSRSRYFSDCLTARPRPSSGRSIGVRFT